MNYIYVQVLVHLDETEIPQANILKRWTRIPSSRSLGNQNHVVPKSIYAAPETQRKKMLVQKVLEWANSESEISGQAFAAAMEALSTRLCVQEEAQHKYHSNGTDNTLQPRNIPTQLPKRMCAGGRPAKTSVKPFTTRTRKAKQNRSIPDALDEDIGTSKKKMRSG